jgi:hypothetical protein
MGDEIVRNKRKFNVAVKVLIVAIVVQAGIFACLKVNKQIENNKSKDEAAYLGFSTTEKPSSTSDSIKINKPSNKSIDISKVQVSSEIMDIIKKSDSKSYEKNINNYKKLLVEFGVPEDYQKEIHKLIKDGFNIPDIFTAYDFLNENYGEVKDLDKLMKQHQSDTNWNEVFKQYKTEVKPFTPSSFSEENLDKLIRDFGLKADDVMIADRISQKGLAKFEDLIEERKQGKKWKDIKLCLELINLQEDLPRAALSSEEVDKYIGGTLSQQQVIDALVLAQRLNESEDEVINKVKLGQSQEDIYVEYYKKKYD